MDKKRVGLIAGSLGAVAAIGGVVWVLTGDGGSECQVTPEIPGESTPTAETTQLEISSDARIELNFGSGRAAKDDSIPNSALIPIPPETPRTPIDLLVLPLERDDASIDTVSARAEVFRNSYRVVACVDPGNASAGNYNSLIYFPESFEARPIEITAALKAKGAEPVGIIIVILAGIAGVMLGHYAAAKNMLVATIALAIPALLTLYVTQVVSDTTFGKGSQLGAYSALALAAFTAATGVSAVATSAGKATAS